MLLQILVAASVMHYVQSQCSFTSWQYSFNDPGQSKCNEINDYIHALYRHDKYSDDDNLSLLDGAQCCQLGDPWRNVDQQVVYEDWTYNLDYDNSWAFCHVGYFLQGLYRSRDIWSPYKGYLNHLEAARCTKPANHPLDYGSCMDVDTTACMSQKGFCYCPDGHWLTGIYRADGDDLYFLKKIRCCTPAAKPLDLDEKSRIQTHIMDTTLWNMANLAHFLGYGWCYGCRGLAVGEDFIRNGNTWAAATTPFWDSRCDGDKNGERLNLFFDNWGFGVKDIVYGQSVIEDLQPETVDSGVIYNRAASPVTESIERSKTIQDTITHTTTSTFTNSHELGISLNFDIGIVSGGTSYTFKYESSTTTTNEQSISQTAGFTKTSTITLEPKEELSTG